MKYFKGPPNVGLWYQNSLCELVGYSDSDYPSCKTDRKNTSGTCHILENALVSWSCKKQVCVVLNTTEAESILLSKKQYYKSRIYRCRKLLCTYTLVKRQ
jgi:hypothetical protein